MVKIQKAKDGFWYGLNEATGETLGFEDEAEARAWLEANTPRQQVNVRVTSSLDLTKRNADAIPYYEQIQQLSPKERQAWLEGSFEPLPQLTWREHKIGFICVEEPLYALCRMRGKDLYEVRHNGLLIKLCAGPLEDAKLAAQRHYEKKGLTNSTR